MEAKWDKSYKPPSIGHTGSDSLQSHYFGNMQQLEDKASLFDVMESSDLPRKLQI